jgi:drug/metabolite transporter (DMT)-like permease
VTVARQTSVVQPDGPRLSIESRNRELVASGSLLVVAAVWGATFVTVKDAISEIDPLSFLTWRFGLSAVALVVILRRPLRASRKTVTVGIVLGLLLGVGYIGQTLGLRTTTVTNAAFITSLYCVMTPILGLVLFNERPGRTLWLAVLTSTLGLWLMTSPDGQFRAGDLVIFIATGFFALQVVLTGRLAGDLDPVSVTAVEMATCSALAAALAVVLGGVTMPTNADVWIDIAVAGLLAGALGYSLQTAAQRHLSAVRTALILISEPIFAAVAGYLLLGERPTVASAVGMGLIIASMGIAALTLIQRPTHSVLPGPVDPNQSDR